MPKKQPREILIVGSKVKSVISQAGLRSDGQLVEAISNKVHDMIEQAIERSQGNKRSTVRPHDL